MSRLYRVLVILGVVGVVVIASWPKHRISVGDIFEAAVEVWGKPAQDLVCAIGGAHEIEYMGPRPTFTDLRSPIRVRIVTWLQGKQNATVWFQESDGRWKVAEIQHHAANIVW